VHLVVATAGSRGDLEPYLALGVRARAGGHRVSIITHALFRERVERLGLGWRPLAGNPQEILRQASSREWMRRATRFNEFRAMREFLLTVREMYRAQLDDLVVGTEDADVVLYSAICRPVAQLRETRDLPTVGGFLQPLTPTAEFPAVGLRYRAASSALQHAYNRVTHFVNEQALWQTARPAVNRWRRDRLGLAALPWHGPYTREHNAHYPILNAFSAHVVPPPRDWPAWVQQTGWWYLDAPDYVPSAGLQQFLNAGAPPVVIGFGSMTSQDAAPLTQLALAAAERAEVRVLFLRGWGNLGDVALPAWAHTEPEVPHSWLFPRVAGVVHHGGSGTTGATARAGVPSCVVPLGFDQQWWASRMHTLSVATEPLPRRALTVDRLAERLRQLREDRALRDRAAALGERVRGEDGVGNAVTFLEAQARHEIRAK
jgi:sterol 3beta-glucosyltransferase